MGESRPKTRLDGSERRALKGARAVGTKGQTSNELRVVSVEIKDVLGAREFAMRPGKVTVLRGRNGSGKSTALQACQAALAGGSLARLARVDASGEETEPEVVLVLEGNGGATYRVERTGKDVRVRARVGDTAGFEDVPRPQAWLSGLFDGGCANPVKFLTAPDKDRALMLLEALPLKLDREELLAEMGVDASELPPVPANAHPLEALALIRDAVFRQRTGVNRDAKGKQAAAEQTRRNAPAVAPEDVSAKVAALEADVTRLSGAVARAEADASAREREAVAAAEASFELAQQRVAGEFKAAAAKLRADFERQAARIREEAERQVGELKKATDEQIAGLKSTGEDELDAAQDAADEAKRKAHDARESARVDVNERSKAVSLAREQLATLRAQAEASAKARALHDQAAQFDLEAQQLELESTRLTKAIDALDRFRRKLADNLPIPGLEIEDKTIRVNGVPFDQLNTTQRVVIAVKVAMLRAKGQRLPVVFVDGAEALDSENFNALVAALKAEGVVQAFLGRVTDEDFQVQVA
jgi:energy-coupling factor transporter ATP-binding protein EcfA2